MLPFKQTKTDSCHDNGIWLDNRHLSWAFAGIILLSFSFFIAGYFVGKRKAVQDLCITLDQESLADKIYTSLCTTPEDSMVLSQQSSTLNESDEMLGSEQCHASTIEADPLVVASSEMQSSIDVEQSEVSQESVPVAAEQYYAQLIGFGREKAALAFADRLSKNNIPVRVNERHSTSVKGKKTTWYQVVTASFSNKQELEKIVDEVKQKERLKDVRIVMC